MPRADIMPRTSRGDARREAILSIARQAFLKDGYAAASMSAIGAKAGGSKATLYNYFPSKSVLFSEVMDDMCSRYRSQLKAEIASSANMETALHRLGTAYVKLMLSDDVITLHRLVVAESKRFPEIGETLYEAGPQLSNAILAEILGRFMNGGELRECKPMQAAVHFYDLCLSGVYRRRLWNVSKPISDPDLHAHMNVALEVFLRAYRR